MTPLAISLNLTQKDELQQAIHRFLLPAWRRAAPGGPNSSPNTSQTTWIIDNIAVCYPFATAQEAAQIVVLSGTNAP
jgi:hypothetical protein